MTNMLPEGIPGDLWGLYTTGADRSTGVPKLWGKGYYHTPNAVAREIVRLWKLYQADYYDTSGTYLGRRSTYSPLLVHYGVDGVRNEPVEQLLALVDYENFRDSTKRIEALLESWVATP